MFIVWIIIDVSTVLIVFIRFVKSEMLIHDQDWTNELFICQDADAEFSEVFVNCKSVSIDTSDNAPACIANLAFINRCKSANVPDLHVQFHFRPSNCDYFANLCVKLSVSGLFTGTLVGRTRGNTGIDNALFLRDV